MQLRRALLVASVVAASLAASEEAQAQYRNFTFGFEGGYIYQGKNTQLSRSNFGIGMFGGWKASRNWWFYGRSLLSFPKQLDNSPNTVIVLHAVPASVRYYFLTDRLRPWVGITNSFQLLLNTTDAIQRTAWWGPGANAGVEIKLRRDMYLGLEGDVFHMFNFNGPDVQVASATVQVIFFL
jgi:hypothetical protein